MKNLILLSASELLLEAKFDHCELSFERPAHQSFESYLEELLGGGQLQEEALYLVDDQLTAHRVFTPADRPYLVNYLAASYYHDCLSANLKALRYCRARKIGWDLIDGFYLGYAPKYPQGGGLLTYIQEKSGLDEQVLLDELLALGLLRKSNFDPEDTYEYFRGRLIFPIFNLGGDVVGFGGRALDPADKIKYLNSTDSQVFKKGWELYGQEALADAPAPALFLAEGYMDVLAFEAHGFSAVASLGTALTQNQAKKLASLGQRVYLAFDGDGAGIRASLKSVERFIEIGVFPRIIRLPDNQDPDDFLWEKGAPGMVALMADSKDAIEYVLEEVGLEEALDLTKKIRSWSK